VQSARDAQTRASSFDFLIGRLTADGIRFGIRPGFQRVLLFGDGLPGASQR
jgi:hypothetical protein